MPRWRPRDEQPLRLLHEAFLLELHGQHPRLRRFRVEQDVYAYVVSRWNLLVQKDGARSIHAYYTFVMNTYDALDRLRRSLSEQRLAAAVETWGRLDSRQPNPLRADTAPAA